jgi:hypothetical protein
MKYLVIALVLLGVSWWGYDVAIDNCHTSNFYLTKWPVVTPTEKPDGLKKILSQPFTYLGKGRQFYVYASSDGKWVLKFMKCQRMNVSLFYEALPMPDYFNEARIKRLMAKEERVMRIFTSLQLAQNVLSDLTGVYYTHLHSESEPELVTLRDPLGFESTLDVNKVPFVLQRRAESVFLVLDKLYIENKREALDARLQQLLDLFAELASRNVVDIDDGAFLRGNIGFLQDRAIYIDVGTFVATNDAKARLPRDRLRLQPVIDWLESKEAMLAKPLSMVVK